MIVMGCLIGLVCAGLWYRQSRIDTRRHSGAFIHDEGPERWVVDFTTNTLYYRYFWKVPHHTDRDLSRDYELRTRRPWRGTGVINIDLVPLWEMRLTNESWTRAKQEALAILENPFGFLKVTRRRTKRVNASLGLKPEWEPVPGWLIGVLNSRREVFDRYQGRCQDGTYDNHPGRVEDIESYLTRKGNSCSSGFSSGSKSPKSPRTRYIVSHVDHRTARKRLASPARAG
jgi:hypothetical protein